MLSQAYYVNAVVQSVFSHARFIIGLCRICSCANERYVIIFICSLLVGVDSVADKLKLELMLHFV